MLLHPPQRGSQDAVLTDLFGIISCIRCLLIQMLRAHDLLEDVRILRINGSFQQIVKILMIIAGKAVLHLTVFIDPDPLTLAVLQINGGHDAVTGLKDRRKLHISECKGMLLAHTLVYILQRQDRVILGAVVLAEVSDHCHIAVFVIFFPAPLAEHIRLLYGRVFGLAQAVQREAVTEFVPV